MKLLGRSARKRVEVGGEENAGGQSGVPTSAFLLHCCLLCVSHTIWSVIILVSLILASIPSFIPK